MNVVATIARRATLTIDLAAIVFNYQLFKQHLTSGCLYAVIKANAYGHGMIKVAKALDCADGFVVSAMAEALALRQVVRQPIICLQGFLDAAELKAAMQARIACVVHQDFQLEILYNSVALPADLPQIDLWLKIDSGMHRLGFAGARAHQLLQDLRHHQRVGQLGIMTHMACADDLNNPATQAQLDYMDAFCAALAVDYPQSFANSATMAAYRHSHRTVARLGLGLYGVNPFISTQNTPPWLERLRPAMRLTSQIIAINEYPEGALIGYGGSYQVPEGGARLAVVAIGYGDGYPLQASSQNQQFSEVVIEQKRCQVRGRVSMDMICVDISDCASAQIGTEVELFGSQLPVNELAASSQNHAYNILCATAGKIKAQYI